MTTFFGKLFASLILGVSSLFVGHPAPITVQTPVEASSTVSVSIAAATSTPVPSVTPITIPTVHPISVKAASTPISPVVVTDPAVTPPVVTTVAAPPLKCVTGKIDIDGSCQWTASSTAIIEANQKAAQAQQADAIGAAEAQEAQHIQSLQQEYQEYETDLQNLQTNVQRACALTTLTVPTGLAAGAAHTAALDCETVSANATLGEQIDEQEESTLQAEINTAQTELGNY